MTITPVRLYGTTDASGDLSLTSTVTTLGLVHEVEWIDGDFADGVDAVISVVRDGNAANITLLTLTNANDDATYRPREPVHDNAGAAVTFDGTNEIYDKPVVNGKLKLVVSSGGNAKSGGCIVYVEK